MTFLKRIFDYLIFGNIWIGFAAIGLSIQTYFQLNIPLHFRPYLFLTFFGTLFIYSLHRIYGVLKEIGNTSERHLWTVDHRKEILISLIIGLIGSIISLFFCQLRLEIFIFPLAIITIGYTLPIIYAKGKNKRLKDVPWLKTFLIAFVWAAVTIFIPLSREANIFNFNLLLILLERSLFIFSITVPFDIRDIEEDVKNGVVSMAVTLGFEKAKKVSVACSLLFIVIITIHYSILSKDFNLLLAFLISGLINTILILQTKKGRSDYFYLFTLDGTMILQPLLVFLFKI